MPGDGPAAARGCLAAFCGYPAGTELTLDYRALLDETDVNLWHDVASGREVRGLSPRETRLRTARALIEILESDPAWDGD